jgi:hypothetical protein
MKKFSPPQMKEVSFPTPYTLHPLSSQEVGFWRELGLPPKTFLFKKGGF